jgi:hypothetical protein
VHEHRVHFQAFFDSLVRDQVEADHLLGEVAHFFRSFANFDSALQTARQMTFSSTPSVNLGLFIYFLNKAFTFRIRPPAGFNLDAILNAYSGFVAISPT